ncbi:transketolase [Litorilinea aerophila]|uniref:Transketolase n=1 Tax=Litorilinea aerophila TaxID=1204385 RepID=A0A540VI28_9CHLR|nr:transketolase [Litorilinea aerophila]MCC9076066.1 transketolase [Litorilinea aerophila]
MTFAAALQGKTLDRDFETKAVNTIRMLAADAVQQANSGHPGMPMGMAQAAFVLWTRYLRYNPTNPHWPNRDRFVLSAGHGSMLLYALLYLTGYDLPLEELKNFRQWGSKTPGHPEYGHTPGVETTTGPLGQGFANGVGMALATHWLAQRFNRPGYNIVDHHIYAIVSDGDLMEGIASEAASLAGHLKLGRLIYLYDDNHITIDGSTEVAYTEDWAKRFEAYGWHVQKVDGLDGEAVAQAIEAAQADPRPSIIGCRTVIGYGSPNKAGTSKVHGEALGEDELKRTKENLGWPLEPRFYVPDDVLQFFRQAVPRGQELEAEHQALLEAYSREYPAEAAEYRQFMAGELPEGWQESIPPFPAGKAVATRNASGAVINALAKAIPNLIGGSADLAGSNKTTIDGSPFLAPGDYSGRNIHFGVREHGMAGILNGMALHGGVIPYGGTFLVFSDYARPSMRLAALMGIRVIYVMTHDSIGLGEDGPTHQPIEHLAALRAIPNMTVIRPADANETIYAWIAALQNTQGPTVLALTRQNLPVYDRAAEGLGEASGLLRGGYVFFEQAEDGLDLVLISTGSEVDIAYQAAKALAAEGVGVRVVSLPSWELFQKQEEAYRQQVLPPGVPRLAIEAATPFGWERWVGNDKSRGDIIGIDHFGASAPYQRIYQEFGLTPERLAERARQLLAQSQPSRA